MKKEEILQKLREADAYVSGQSLCETFGVSRTAVWKAVSALKAEGYEIEAVTNKGYRLVEHAADTMDADELARFLAEAGCRFTTAERLVFHKETGSTNEDIQNLADSGAPEGTLAVAAKQTRGRGRRGRTWISPPDGNVYMSLLLRPGVAPDRVPMVTPLMAMAVRDAMAKAMDAAISEDREAAEESGAAKLRCLIKWPNDVVVGVPGDKSRPFKKVCGILTEMRMEEREIRDVVIGVGLNLNMGTIPEELSNTATSLMLALDGRKVDRARVAAETIAAFEKYYEKFLAAGDLSAVRKEYEAMLVNRNRTVRVLDPKGEYDGIALGIDAEGALLVKASDGTVTAVYAGEVSVRGVEGYV